MANLLYDSLKVSMIKKLLFFVIVLGVFFRLYHLSSVPPSLSLDEVSIGYNAYSILGTGADEYGTRFPLLLRAYDDFRPALYVYLVVPFVKFFGLNALSVRLPSVILSIVTLVAVFYLVRELIPEVSLKKKRISGEIIALISTFLLAISPWHIYLSRLGHEVNAGFAFFIFGLLFLLKKKIYLATPFIMLAFISYQTEKIFIPLFFTALIIIYWRDFVPYWKKLVLSFIIGVIVLAPFITQSFSEEGLLRFRGTNIFTANEERFFASAKKLMVAKNFNNLLDQVLYNRRIVALDIVGEAYFSHFNPYWLFQNSGGEKHKVPFLGLLYIWELPFIILGSLVLCFFINKKTRLLLIAWMLLAPLSSSITTEAPHAMRSLVFLPTFQILTALGLYGVYAMIRNSFFQKAFMVSLGAIIIVSINSLFINYFSVFPKTQSASFQYALHQAIRYTLKNESQYSKIVFSNQNNLYQSYMFYLFESKYDPFLYQKQGGTKSGGFAETHAFGKYEFRPVNFKKEPINKGMLYIMNSIETLENQPKLKTFKNLDGTEAINLLTN